MSEDTYLNKLNAAQREAVNDTEGQLLVLAGAGSGKTRVLTTRVAYLVKDKGVEPYHILAITFTNKAAGEMKTRIAEMLGEQADVWISTFHSMCAQILFREGSHIGYGSNFSIYSELESSRTMKRILREREARGDKDAFKLYDAYFGHVKRIKSFNIDPSEYAQCIGDSRVAKNVISVFNEYEKALKDSNAMDFDDLLINTVKLFTECPEVLEKYATRFRYIHVDEFQDTNKIQYKLVKLLSSVHGNLFVVGDEDQSIYGWRGAEIANIMDFKSDFPNAKVYKLEENYRSTTQILNAANRVISNNRNRYDKKLFTSKEGGKRVEIFNAYNDREEIDYVVRNIKDLVSLTDINYGDVAILMRANSLSRQFEEALTIYSIPYRVYGGIRFYERKEIKDVLAYVRIALNPKDVDSVARIINFPKRGIGDTTVAKLAEYSKTQGIELHTLVKNIESYNLFNAGTSARIKQFGALWDVLIKAVGEKNPVDFVEHTLKVSGVLDAYKSDEAEPDKYENVKEFLSAVSEFNKDNPGKNIGDFMRMVALISDTDEIDGSNTVTLATIHAVKGLEFPVVFIVALEENIFPSSRTISDNDSVEEERRLMYVAITRAKERLYCSSARSRFRFNQRQSNLRSRFVGEMSAGTAVTQPSLDAPQMPAQPKHTTRQQTPIFGGINYKNTSSTANNPALYSAGKRVIHPKFGEGVIVTTSGEGNEKVASISFEGIGIKKFVVAIANMKLVEK